MCSAFVSTQRIMAWRRDRSGGSWSSYLSNLSPLANQVRARLRQTYPPILVVAAFGVGHPVIAGDLNQTKNARDAEPFVGITDAGYIYRENDTSFRVIIVQSKEPPAGNVVVLDEDATNRFISRSDPNTNALRDPDWKATVRIKTEAREAGPGRVRDKLTFTVSDVQHITAPHAGEAANGPVVFSGAPIKPFKQTFNARGNAELARIKKLSVKHDDGANKHVDNYSIFYGQEVSANGKGPDFDSWSLQIEGDHEEKKGGFSRRTEKKKDITISEDTTRIKTILVDIAAVLEPDSVAEARAIGLATLSENNVQLGSRETGGAPHHEGLINESISDLAGNMTMHQAVGRLINQGSFRAVATLPTGVTGSEGPGTMVDSQSVVEQTIESNIITSIFTPANGVGGDNGGVGDGDTALLLSVLPQSAVISDSINDVSGIVGVNQAVGSVINQTEATTLSIGQGSIVALADSDLDQLTSSNELVEVGGVHTASVQNSMNGNTGIVYVQNANGTAINQASVFSAAAAMGSQSGSLALPTVQ